MIGSKGIIIEIGKQEVRGVLFSSFFGKTRIEKREASPVENGEIASAVERLLSVFPSDAAVTLQLPGHLFMVRGISLPFSDRKKIRKTLPYELDGLLPYPVDDMLIDSVLSVSPAKGSSVIALAIPKKVAANYLDMFPEGRRPAKIIPDFISLISLGINIGNEDDIYGVLEIDNTKASIALISKEKPILVRSIDGSDLQSTVSKINSTMKSFTDKGQKIGRIYLTGKSAREAGPLLKGTSQLIHLPTALGNLSLEDSSWSVLSGGALAAIEFPSFNALGPGSEDGNLLKTISIGTAILLIFGTADLYLHYRNSSQRFYALKTESRKVFMSALPQVKRVVKEDVQLKDALNKEKGTRESLVGKSSPLYLDALKGLGKITVDNKGVRIREAVFEGNNLALEGDGKGINAEDLKKIFSGIGGAKGALVEEMVQGVEPNSYRFRVKIELK